MLQELYSSGINHSRSGFVMNPIRRVLWNLCKPYFEHLLRHQSPEGLRAAQVQNHATQVVGELRNMVDAQVRNQIETQNSISELLRTVDAQAHRIKMLEKIIENIQLSILGAE